MRWVVLLLLVACGRDRDDSLEALVAKAAADLPGLQVVVESHGVVILDKSYGYADLENSAPVTADTIFAIGSISKQFGAAAVMQLVEAGKLSLDDPLAKYMPDYPRGERIRLRDLLRHTSGIEDFEYTGPWPPTMAVERTDAEMVALFRDRPPRFEPNTKWSYSTSNYVLLGMIVAQVSGMPLREYMQKNVFARAGLEKTRFCDAYELIPHRAFGYDTKDDHWIPAKMAVLTEFSFGGGLCSTARDMLRWQKALESGRVVSAQSYAQMSTPTPLADGTPIGYGFGLFPGTVAGHRVISHTGGVSGFASYLFHFVDDDLRIVANTNARRESPWFQIAAKELDLGQAAAVSIPVAELAKYEKTFRFEPGEARFFIEGDHLAAGFKVEGEDNHMPLVYVGNDTFESANRYLSVKFTVDHGRVTALEQQADGMMSYVRFP